MPARPRHPPCLQALSQPWLLALSAAAESVLQQRWWQRVQHCKQLPPQAARH